SFRKVRPCSRADNANLGFAISLVTSASVALGDCFFVLLLPIAFRYFLSRVNCPRLQTAIAGPQSLQQFKNGLNEKLVQQRSHRMIHKYLNLPTAAFLP